MRIKRGTKRTRGWSLILTIMLCPVLFIIAHANVVQASTTVNIGDYVQFGTYYNQPIIWRVIHKDADGDPLLFADNILSIKPFDARGSYHAGNSNRLSLGSNYYPGSNIRQWLNSAQTNTFEDPIVWWQNPPNGDNLLAAYNPYHVEKGFLADGNFTSVERNLIKPLTHKVALAGVDESLKDGGTQPHAYDTSMSNVMQNYDTTAFFKNVTDQVFLLSVKQLREYVFARGWDVRAKPTQRAVEESDYVDASFLNRNSNWYYWLNTPTASNANSTRNIDYDGGVGSYSTSLGVVGVRPALMLDLSAVAFNTGGTGAFGKPYVVNNGVEPLTDLEWPSAPGTLTASNVTGSSITITWVPATDNVGVTAYEVYRGTTLAGTVTGNLANLPTDRFQLTGLTPGTTYNLSVRARDPAGNLSVASPTLTVRTRSAPTDITSSGSSIEENRASNTLVATLTAVDFDTDDLHTFSLVAGVGSTDNSLFSLSGGNLRTAAVFDFETKASYSVRVRVTDRFGLTFEKMFLLTVVDQPETVNVQFDGQSGIVIPSSQTKWEGTAYGLGSDGMTAQPLPIPTRMGYTFAGWYDAPDATGNLVQNATIVVNGAPHTLYANWNINHYSLTYHGNGQTSGTAPNVQSGAFNSTVVVSANTGLLQRTGYTFVGWNTMENGAGTVYAVGSSLLIGVANVSLFAQWTINRYSLSYNGNDQTNGVAPDPQSAEYNSVIEIAANTGGLERLGHTFVGWNTAANGSGIDFAVKSTLTIGTSHAILYAKWVVNRYTLTYDGNGHTAGAIPVAQTAKFQGIVEITEEDSLVRVGYTFAGWNTLADGSGTVYLPGDNLVLGAENVTLYAQWQINMYTLSFETNTSAVITSQTVPFLETFVAPSVPNRPGFSFAGWFVDIETAIQYDFSTPAIEHLTLHAKWTNDAPTALVISTLEVPENRGVDYLIATLSAVDPDPDTLFSFTFGTADDDADERKLKIIGNGVYTTENLDFENQPTLSVRIRVSDGFLHYEEVFVLHVLDQNERATQLTLSHLAIAENAGPDVIVAKIANNDPDESDVKTYRLVDGPGSADNTHFYVIGDKLYAKSTFNFESDSQYTLRLEVSDGQLTYEQSFHIQITDVNEAPLNLMLSEHQVDRNVWLGYVIGSFSTIDLDAGDSHAYQLVSGEGDNDNDSFFIEGGALKNVIMFNSSTRNTYSIRVRARDSQGLTAEQMFKIEVLQPNAILSGGNRVVTIFFQENIVIDSSRTAMQDLQKAILKTTNANQEEPLFVPLANTDSIKIRGNQLVLNLSEPLVGYFNRFKINAGALRDRSGNRSPQLIISPLVVDDLGPDLLKVSVSPSRRMLTLVFNEKVYMGFTDSNIQKNMERLRAAITISRNASDATPIYGSLGARDKLSFKGVALEISLASALTGSDNRIRIEAAALRDNLGNRTNEIMSSVINLDSTGPILNRVTLSPNNKNITLLFNEPVFNAWTAGSRTVKLAALKAAISLSVNAHDATPVYSPLKPADTVELRNGQLFITLAEAISGGHNRLRIAANALRDESGNRSLQLLSSMLIADVSAPEIRAVNVHPKNRIITIRFNEAIKNALLSGSTNQKNNALKSKLLLGLDTETDEPNFVPLTRTDRVVIRGDLLIVTLTAPIQKDKTYSFKIATGAVQDLTGNMNEEIISPTFAIDSSGPKLR